MIAIYILVGVLGGALLVGVVVAVMVFFRELRNLRESIDSLRSILASLSKDDLLVNSLKALSELVSTGQAVLKGLNSLGMALDIFNKLIIKGPTETPQSSLAPDGSSSVYSYDEVDAAIREDRRRLRKEGINLTEEPEDQEVPKERAVGDQV